MRPGRNAPDNDANRDFFTARILRFNEAGAKCPG